MRAREPDSEGYVDRDGVKLHYEVFGDGRSERPLDPAPYRCEPEGRSAPAVLDASQSFPEPHSTKQIEDCVGWDLETTPQAQIATEEAPDPDEAAICRWCARVRHPVLVVHGDRDRISPLRSGTVLARATGGSLVVLEGAGHIPHARDPVRINRLIREFAESLPAGGPA